ncbi:MAG TPA: hypothetical protein VFI02_01245, partial [Armatimonadota bacterium]|nr:hypothetical protein [Armatimonadota bacterium]
ELHSPPPFGSFVKVAWNGPTDTQPDDPFELQPAIYAVVHHASTAPVNTGRRLRAFWKDEEELKEQQPELDEWMLVTNFRAVIIGYCANGQVSQILPPKPPKLLTRVYPCEPGEIKRITEQKHFLRTLLLFPSAPTEEVVAAAIRTAWKICDQDSFLVDAGKELANLLKDDYDRLQAIMRRVAQ